jgi:hypothetical protein
MTEGGKGREDWVATAKRENFPLFSELDVLLRALDQFFVIENLPQSVTQYNVKNFKAELTAAKDVIIRILGIIELIIPEHRKNVFWFKKFAEARLMTGRKREELRAELLKQDTREKSLYLLYESLTNMKALSMDLLKGKTITVMSFRNIGEIISKDIRENTFFNPFRATVDPEMDQIENPRISHIVRHIKDKETKRAVSIVFLHLFRLLRYLRHIDRSPSQPVMNLHTSVVVMILLRSECAQFWSFAERARQKLPQDTLAQLLDTIAYQFRMETRRVYDQELRDVLETKSAKTIRGKIQNSHGILNNLIEQSIIQIAQYWEPDLKGDGVFMIFITKAEQSVKLREDLYVLNRLIAQLLSGKGKPSKGQFHARIVMNYMEYFESFSFKLLRYDDYEEFLALFATIKAVFGKDDMAKFVEHLHQLSVLIGTTIRHVENRAELMDRPMDIEKAESIVRQYTSIT